jgi:hypothetical protein
MENGDGASADGAHALGDGENYPNVNLVGNERWGARITSLGFALPSCSIYGIACLDYRREPWVGRNFGFRWIAWVEKPPVPTNRMGGTGGFPLLSPVYGPRIASFNILLLCSLFRTTSR